MTRDRLLKIMINTFVSCMNPGYPISIRNIAHLETEGLVQKESFHYSGDYNYEYGCYESEGYLIKGWVITNKCRQLKQYKEAQQKEIKIIESCFEKKSK